VNLFKSLLAKNSWFCCPTVPRKSHSAKIVLLEAVLQF